MLSTLFHIPHEIAGVPVFGFGWALGACVVFSVILLLWLFRRQGWDDEARSFVPFLLMLAGACIFLAPQLEERDVNGQPLGVPIRGYGTFVMVGVVSAVVFAGYRARLNGLDPDHIYSMAFWLFVAGIGGGRLFYVVQHWGEFQQPTLWATLIKCLKFTEGGLVVFGAFIGGGVAAFAYAFKYKLPAFAVADLVAPSVMLGLAFGRLGCLMNGCCYGDICERGPALQFPQGHSSAMYSPPYEHQLMTGQLFGLRLRSNREERVGEVLQVVEGSAAARAGLKTGDRILSINGELIDNFGKVFLFSGRDQKALMIKTLDERTLHLQPEPLPARSLPVYPIQIYAALDAALLFFVLWLAYPFRRRDGEVFALLLTLHPLSRYLQELIRDDEPGRFGTPFTIAQLVGFAIVAGGLATWFYLARQPRGTHPFTNPKR